MKEWEIETEHGFTTWFAKSQGVAEREFAEQNPKQRIVGVRLVGPAPEWVE